MYLFSAKCGASGKTAGVVLEATWCSNEERRNKFQFETPLGGAIAWLREKGGVGELILRVDVAPTDHYIEPQKYCALGAIAFWDVPNIRGTSAKLKLTAVPREWLEHSDQVLGFFREGQLQARIVARSLEISSVSLCPSDLLKRAAPILFGFDTFSRKRTTPKMLEGIRRSAIKAFKQDAGAVLVLLDQSNDSVFRRSSPRSARAVDAKRRREEAIVSAVNQLGMSELVQFNCGRGGLLQKLIDFGEFRKLVGVEPSSTLAVQANARLQPTVEILHGSLLDPPSALTSDSLALLVDALPPSSDRRLERVAEVLFGGFGFAAVFCIEAEDGSQWPRLQLDEWGTSVAASFGYEVNICRIENSHSVLLRRGAGSPERRKVRNTYTPEIHTQLGRRVEVDVGQWRKTLEAFSKWTVDPRWLIYLPPGLCSLQTKQIDGPLEQPRDAFDYYRSEGILKVVAEFKHMGSRAIAVVCRDEAAGKKRFGEEALGSIYTRNGRPFWEDATPVLAALRDGLTRARFWERFDTDWVCLDCELLPWTLKAENLMEESHGEMLHCGEATLENLSTALAALPPDEVSNLDRRLDCFRRYRTLYERYLVQAGEPYSFAPFHLIATESRSYFGQDHNWHMEVLNAIVRRAGDPFGATAYRTISLDDETAIAECCKWWEELSQSGAEGLVIKPLYFVPRGRRGMAQPGIKCRGVEHLRMVYGPEYDLVENRWDLANRDALLRRREKHRRVLKQFALSVEAVERFVNAEPLRDVEQCVRGVLALDR